MTSWSGRQPPKSRIQREILQSGCKLNAALFYRRRRTSLGQSQLAARICHLINDTDLKMAPHLVRILLTMGFILLLLLSGQTNRGVDLSMFELRRCCKYRWVHRKSNLIWPDHRAHEEKFALYEDSFINLRRKNCVLILYHHVVQR